MSQYMFGIGRQQHSNTATQQAKEQNQVNCKNIILSILVLVSASACAAGNINLRDDQVLTDPRGVAYLPQDQLEEMCQNPFASACEISGYIYMSTDISDELRIWFLVHEELHRKGYSHGKRENTHQYNAFNRAVARRYKQVTNGAMIPIEFAPRHSDTFGRHGFSD